MATTYLYRLWGDDESLLYVGISKTLVSRLTQHDARQPWADEVVSVTAQKYATRKEALEAERAAIESERPRYNKQHNYTTSSRQEMDDLWVGLPGPHKQSVILAMNDFIDSWPDAWRGSGDVAIRRAVCAIAALMELGATPGQAIDRYYAPREAAS